MFSPPSGQVLVERATSLLKTCWSQSTFELPWREAGPPNHHDHKAGPPYHHDHKVDSDQQVVSTEPPLSDTDKTITQPYD